MLHLPARNRLLFDIVLSVCLLMSLPALAGEERRIKATEIVELLANAKVAGKGFEQLFGDPRGKDSASTTYWEGRNSSFGRWKVEGDRYCSQWGANAAWACYAVSVVEDGGETRIIWTDSSGRRFIGVLQESGT